MSTLYAERVRTLVADWVGANTIPDTEGLSGWTPPDAPAGSIAIGSDSRALFVRNSSAASVTGWRRQTWHTKIFNVKNYGAVGDNTADDRNAIRAAITAAGAAGGGTVYFPPGQYRLPKGSPADVRATFLLNGSAFNNISFLGDGAASKLRMAGSAGFGDMIMFRPCAGVEGLTFENLAFDAAQTSNPDPAEQQHFIQFQGRSGDTAGASKCSVTRCYFGEQVGDGVRMLGEAAAVNQYINVSENDFSMISCRACICVQRYSSKVFVSDNFLTGSDDNALDMEPTGGGNNAHYTVARNIFEHQSKAVAALTLTGNGTADPFNASSVVDNIIVNGGPVILFNVSNLTFAGNIIHENGTLNNGGTLRCTRRVTELIVADNVVISESGATSRVPLTCQSDSLAQPQRTLFADNVVYGSRCGVGVLFESCREMTFTGNLVVANTDGTGSTGILLNRAVNFFVDNFNVRGNMLLAPGAGMSLIATAAASPFNLGNISYNQNFGRSAGASGLQIVRSVAELFTGVYTLANNMVLGVTSSDIVMPTTNVGATLEGNAAASASKIVCMALAAGPEGLTPGGPGALCVNTLGVQGLVTFLKESGVGSTGWKKTTNKILWAGARTVGNTAGTLFLPAMTTVAAPLAATAQIMIPRQMVFRNFRVKQTPGTGAGNNVFTIRVKGVAQALTITVAFTATGGVVTLATPLVAAAGLVDFTVARSAAPITAPTDVVISMECD